MNLLDPAWWFIAAELRRSDPKKWTYPAIRDHLEKEYGVRVTRSSVIRALNPKIRHREKLQRVAKQEQGKWNQSSGR